MVSVEIERCAYIAYAYLTYTPTPSTSACSARGRSGTAMYVDIHGQMGGPAEATASHDCYAGGAKLSIYLSHELVQPRGLGKVPA